MDNWNLNILFKNENELNRFCASVAKKAIAFEKTYSQNLDKIQDLEPVLAQYEELCENLARIMTYAFLIFAKDCQQGAFYSKYELKSNEIEKSLVFFELELCKLDLSHIKSKKYGYFLKKLQYIKKYQLSTKEEKILLSTAPIAKDAFSRLFDECINGLNFKIDNKILKLESILSLLHHSERKTRKNAQKSLTKTLEKNIKIFQYIINIVRKDNVIKCQLRGYTKPESARHITNQISQKSLDSMINLVNANFGLVQRYYKLKCEILGLKKLKDYDRYAPIGSSQKMPYNQAKNLVIGAYSDFEPSFGKIVENAFKNGWVDSHPANNKQSGAFSHSATPKAHPFVLLNYTENRRDVFTIAHEFGHAIHQELSKGVGFLNMDTPLTTAETASVFGEMLLFDKIKKTLPKNELIPLYAGKIEDIFSTLFRQVVMTNFERAIHEKKDELSINKLNAIWQNENKKMFGDSLKLTPNYALWWSYIPHFIHTPFYCYAYAYGQLLSLTLFGIYKSGLKDFPKKYKEFLSLGGSKSPKDLVKIFGFDVEDINFWQFGMNEVNNMLGEFESLLKGRK